MKIENLDDIYWYSKDKPVQHFFFRGFSSNIFIINQGDELWMIDAGSSPLNRIKRIIKKIDRDLLNSKNISRIFLTHSHSDHVTGLKDIIEYSDPEVYIHKDDLETLSKPLDFTMEPMNDLMRQYEFGIASKVPIGLLRIGTIYVMGEMPCVNADYPLENGEIFKGSKYSLEVIHTPGHTPGHSCYYLPELKCMFIGDLFDPEFNNKPPLNTPIADYDKFYNSIEKLLDYDVEYLLMAHASQIYTGSEENRKMVEIALNNMKIAWDTTMNLLEANREHGLRLKDFSGEYPKETWPERVDHYTIAFSILKKLMNEGRAKYENRRFYLID